MIEELINKNYVYLTDVDIHISNYILNNKKQCADLTIDEIAKKCSCSRTTILRFSKKIGLKGYSELRYLLKYNYENNDIKNDYFLTIKQDIYKFLEDIDNKNLDKICNYFYSSDRIFVYGTGTLQNNIALELKRMFLTIGKFIIIIKGDTERKIVLEEMNKNDCIIIISFSGETKKVKEYAKNLKLKDVKIISITKFQHNTLSSISNENLYVLTSKVSIKNNQVYETSSLFYVLVEYLFLKYNEFLLKKIKT